MRGSTPVTGGYVLHPREQEILSLTQRVPSVSHDSLIAQLWIPPEFTTARFDTYSPDPAHRSQAAAQQHMRVVCEQLQKPAGFFRRRRRTHHTYLDGGFGVGKTHLLASAAHSLGSDHARFGTFVEFTQLVGALGYHPTLAALAHYTLICIDEFELDDPGDTLIMARLVRELGERGTTVITTSNTLPESLGDGRFAAADFQREIQGLSDHFTVVTIDGPDYRHRDGMIAYEVWDDDQVSSKGLPPIAVDDFAELLSHISTIHPSRYRNLVEGVPAALWRNAFVIERENHGLRIVALVDRLYDAQIPILLTGQAVAELFAPALLNGPYRKKYLRCQSRLSALGREAQELLGLKPSH